MVWHNVPKCPIGTISSRSTLAGNMAKSKHTTQFENWLAEFPQDRPESDRALLRRAFDVADQAHRGQKRASGEPYISHSLATAHILAELRLDTSTLAAALLHDTLEDTDITYEQLEAEFGTEIASLVDGVTKLGTIDQLSGLSERSLKQDAQAESLRKMFLAMVEDIRVVLIKLADRLHNMRTLGSLPEEKRKRIALEALEAGIDSEVYGRSKHAYSVFRKMQRKAVEFDQIYDVRAVRIIVEEVRDCYAALGAIHGKWSPIPGEFDDYIATPKDNLYRSLHTAVVGPGGTPLEVQIRTYDMHHTAELGIAAHWRYKESHKPDPAFDDKIAWLRQLMEWPQDLADAHEFVDSLKTDVFQEHVYAFTPKGDIFELPYGATPIDFAYYVHTEVGSRCRGAKVNGRLVSLDYQLKNGDMVEILTAKRGGPSLDWLNPHLGYVKTTRARSKIRQWLKRQNREQNIAQGRVVLEAELKRLGISDIPFEQIARKFNLEDVEDVLAAIGAGDINSLQIAGRVLDLVQPIQTAFEMPTPQVRRRPVAPAGVRVRGVGDLLTHLAQCCNPLPGDPILGYVTRGRGVTIHRQDCPSILRLSDSERLIEVEWGEEATETYPVHVEVEAFDRPGLMRDITSVIAEETINMSAANMYTHPKNHMAKMMLTLQITDVNQLSRVLARIARLPNVVEAVRQTR